MVFFDSSLRNVLESAREKKEAVSVVDCSVNRPGKDGVEIVGNKNSKLWHYQENVLPETFTFNANLEHNMLQLCDVDMTYLVHKKYQCLLK